MSSVFRRLFYIISFILKVSVCFYFISIGGIGPGIVALFVGGLILWMEYAPKFKFVRLIENLAGERIGHNETRKEYTIDSINCSFELIGKGIKRSQVVFSVMQPLKRKHWKNDFEEIYDSLVKGWDELKIHYNFDAQALCLQHSHSLSVTVMVPINDGEEVIGGTLTVIRELINKYHLFGIKSFLRFNDYDFKTYIYQKGNVIEHAFKTEFSYAYIVQHADAAGMIKNMIRQDCLYERITEEEYWRDFNRFASLPFVFDKVEYVYDDKHYGKAVILSASSRWWCLVCTYKKVFFAPDQSGFDKLGSLHWNMNRVVEVRLLSKGLPMMLCEDGSLIGLGKDVDRGNVDYYIVTCTPDEDYYSRHKADFDAAQEMPEIEKVRGYDESMVR